MTIKQLRQKLHAIKESINYSDFPSEKDELLIQAFVRRSYSQEHPEWQHNQVLEFIGDSVLDAYFIRKMCNPKSENFGKFTKKYQFSSSKTEGELTKIKADYVNGSALAKHIDNLNLAQFLILGGADEKNNVRNKQNVKEDLFEAIVGAIALACDFDNDKIDKVCSRMLELDKQSAKNTNANQNQKIAEMRKLVGNISMENAVQKLTILNQNGYIPVPKYEYKGGNKSGTPKWFCTCSVDGYGGRINTDAQGKKKIARQISAFGILNIILGYEKD